MATSYRVRKDEFSPNCQVVMDNKRNEYCIDLVKGQWRIYEVYSDYNTVSGGIIVRGMAVRRYDPQAGDLEGKIANFETFDAALAYGKKWLQIR